MSTSHQLLEELSFCVIDLETTGGNHLNDEIIEIGMVHIDHMEIGETKSYLINPKRDIPEFIQKLTNITTKSVQDAPFIENVLDDILNFIGDRIVVAHNSSFDVPFLNSVLRRLKRKELTNKVICTNVMTKHLIPEIMSSNLGYMSNIFNIAHDQAHRAIEDAVATGHLLIHYLKSFERRNIDKVNQLYYPRNRFEIDRIKFQHNNSEDYPRIKKLIDEAHTNLLLIFKGSKGVFESIIPYDHIRGDKKLIYNQLESIKWTVLTIKQIGPILDGCLFLNTHFYKLDDQVRAEILNYLNVNELPCDPKYLENFDFLMTPHLIKGQYIIYNLLNLSAKSRLVFRYPGHEKKVTQQVKSHINRFENNQKSKKKIHVYPELVTIVANEIKKLMDKNHASAIKLSEFKSGKVNFKFHYQNLSNSPLLKSDFPFNHI